MLLQIQSVNFQSKQPCKQKRIQLFPKHWDGIAARGQNDFSSEISSRPKSKYRVESLRLKTVLEFNAIENINGDSRKKPPKKRRCTTRPMQRYLLKVERLSPATMSDANALKTSARTERQNPPFAGLQLPSSHDLFIAYKSPKPASHESNEWNDRGRKNSRNDRRKPFATQKDSQ